jgi:hypothetical protein
MMYAFPRNDACALLRTLFVHLSVARRSGRLEMWRSSGQEANFDTYPSLCAVCHIPCAVDSSQ